MTSFPQKSNLKITIVLCTYNGEKFLEQQLNSLANQTVGPLNIFVSDDGSTDNTFKIIERCQNLFPQLTIKVLTGPQKGFAYNFLSFFDSDHLPEGYIAYADQDDIWEADKLEKAINWLEGLPINQAGLYGSRTRLIDEQGQAIGLSPLFKKKPGFANALVQNIMGGNTMVMNTEAWRIMKAAAKQSITSHDLWTYQMISGAGGAVFYDPHPSLLYRQHANNIIGANNSIKARFERIKLLFKGHLRHQSEVHVTSLLAVKHLLIEDNQRCLEYFARARGTHLWQRLYAFKKSGVYRQTFLGTLALWAAVVLRKV